MEQAALRQDLLKRLNPMHDPEREVMANQLILAVLTAIPAIAIGMLQQCFAPDQDE